MMHSLREDEVVRNPHVDASCWVYCLALTSAWFFKKKTTLSHSVWRGVWQIYGRAHKFFTIHLMAIASPVNLEFPRLTHSKFLLIRRLSTQAWIWGPPLTCNQHRKRAGTYTLCKQLGMQHRDRIQESHCLKPMRNQAKIEGGLWLVLCPLFKTNHVREWPEMETSSQAMQQVDSMMQQMHLF